MGGGSLFGLIMLIGSIALYALGRIKPEIRRDSDIIYVCVGIVYAITTIVSVSMAVIPPGIVEFQNLLAVGCIISLMWQNIRDRQAKPPMPGREGAFDNLRQRFSSNARRRPSGDEGRSPSGVYRYEAEFDDYSRFNGPAPTRDQRRIQGSEPPRGGYEGGYDDRYDERPRRPRPALNDADRPRDEFGDRAPRRPAEPGPRPSAPRTAPRTDAPRPNSSRTNDWDDDFGAPNRGSSRPGGDSFGPNRGLERSPSRGPDRSPPPRPRDDRSMEGRPITGPILDDEDSNDQFSTSRSPDNRPANGGSPLDLDRPPMDMPPRRRPRAEGPRNDEPRNSTPPQDRPPLGQPLEGPLAGARSPGPRTGQVRDGGDRPSRDLPPRRPPGAERPVIDAAPLRTARPQPGGPAPVRPLDSPGDDYVDFKPVEPPPADEFDNSNQFDD